MVYRYTPLRRAASALVLLALGVTLGAGPAAAQAYRTFLAGANEVPPVETSARGIVTADLDGNVISVGGYFEDLTSDVVAAHIHQGAADENGPVLFPLVVTSSEESTAGRFETANNAFTLDAGQLAALEVGNLYINVHTSMNPGGEIRGQLVALDGVMPISDAREEGVGAEVTVQGVVTRAKGQFAWFQDGTAGLAIRQVDGSDFFAAVASGDIAAGALIEVTGTISEFPTGDGRGGALQFNEAGLASYSIVGELEPPLPQTLTLTEIIENGEAHESELVRVLGVSVAADPGATFEAATSYSLAGRETVFANGLRIGNAGNTDVDGIEIPDEQIIVTGVVAQFSFDGPDLGYQILPIEEVDVLPFLRAAVQVIHNSPDPAAAVVDVYVDILGDNEPSMKFDDVAFRSATDFMGLPTGFPIRLFIAPGTSADEGDAIFERTYTLEDDQAVILIANGVLDPAAVRRPARAAPTSASTWSRSTARSRRRMSRRWKPTFSTAPPTWGR